MGDTPRRWFTTPPADGPAQAPADPLPDLSADFYDRGGRGVYTERVRRGYPRNLTVPAPRWDDLTDREQARHIADFRAGLTAALDPQEVTW